MEPVFESTESGRIGDAAWARSVLGDVPAVIWEGRGNPGQQDFRIEYVSDFAERLLGHSAQRWLNEPGFWLEIVHPEDRQLVLTEMSTAGGSRSQVVKQFRWRRADGQHLWAEAQTTVLSDEEGEPVGLRGVVLDITARKEVELEAQAVSEQLAHLSRVSVLNELGGAIAHELNQPLTAILASAQAALRYLRSAPQVPSEVTELLGSIAEQSRRGGDIISHLRAMMRKEEPKMEMLSINAVVLKLLQLIYSDLVTRNVHVATELSPELPEVHADSVQLQQLLLNLILNGCEAMSAYQPTRRRLEIRTSARLGGIELAVRDCGTGIGKEVLGTMFEPFTTTKRRGLGMGLAICRTIATGHGGSLMAQNNHEAGATFTLHLPSGKERL